MTHTPETVKEWLWRYKAKIDDYSCIRQRIILMEQRSRTVQTSQLDGIPHNGTKDHDHYGIILGQIEEMENEASEMLAQSKEIYTEIKAIVAKISGRDAVNRKAVILSRYLDLMPWENVTNILFGKKDDYIDREDTYLRRTFRIHADAITELIAILDAQEESEDHK